MLNLQQDSFQGHDLLLRVDAEDLEVCVGGQLPDGSDQVAALLRSLLAFAGQEQAASGHRLKEKKSFEIFSFLIFFQILASAIRSKMTRLGLFFVYNSYPTTLCCGGGSNLL